MPSCTSPILSMQYNRHQSVYTMNTRGRKIRVRVPLRKSRPKSASCGPMADTPHGRVLGCVPLNTQEPPSGVKTIRTQYRFQFTIGSNVPEHARQRSWPRRSVNCVGTAIQRGPTQERVVPCTIGTWSGVRTIHTRYRFRFMIGSRAREHVLQSNSKHVSVSIERTGTLRGPRWNL